nr:CtsR family transcriptional regulator [Clostridia bacterium]
MGISDMIAEMIEKMLEEGGGNAEIKRNDLAGQIGCVPSQINYVITSRFTPERGYVIESRRGGGGYIRITRKALHKSEYLMHMFASVG